MANNMQNSDFHRLEQQIASLSVGLEQVMKQVAEISVVKEEASTSKPRPGQGSSNRGRPHRNFAPKFIYQKQISFALFSSKSQLVMVPVVLLGGV